MYVCMYACMYACVIYIYIHTSCDCLDKMHLNAKSVMNMAPSLSNASAEGTPPVCVCVCMYVCMNACMYV